MAVLDGELWKHNFVRIRFVDVTDDYRLMQPPLPSDFYPVVMETWVPVFRLDEVLAEREWVNGYLYDWHESPFQDCDDWVVGLVQESLLDDPAFQNAGPPIAN